MADNTKELDALITALNKSAERLQNLWFTFLVVTVYFAIAAFTTTHRMLLLEEAQILPVLNAKLPLLPFYVATPAIYVVLHTYFLMMLVLLARTAKSFDDEVSSRKDMPDSARERYRMRLENSVFLQIIVGARRERNGTNGLALHLIALTTLVIAPTLLLLLFLLMFLPYHSVLITWWHRILVSIDLIVSWWILWPSYRWHWGSRFLPEFKWSFHFASKAVLTGCVFCFIFLVATFPGELNHWKLGPEKIRGAVFGYMKEVIVNPSWIEKEPLIPETYNSRGIFPNRLWLPNENLIDEVILKRDETRTSDSQWRPVYTIDLSNRNLVGAVLKGADLRSANLQNADLASADLSAASLEGALLDHVHAQGIYLQRARLQGASMEGANLLGARLGQAELQGVVLNYAQVQGAMLGGADLQGASLYRADLSGADLDATDLQGANLTETRLQGASLSGAVLHGAILVGAQVWRTYAMNRPEGIWVPDDLTYGQTGRSLSETVRQSGVFGGIVFVEKARITRILSNQESLRGTSIDWDALLRELPSDSTRQLIWGEVIRRIVCSGNGAPYVARNILRMDDPRRKPPTQGHKHLMSPDSRREVVQRLRERARLKTEDLFNCPGARGLLETDLESLVNFAR